MRTAVREVSITAYRAHQASGALSAQERTIVQFLARSTGAPTRAEIATGTGLRVASVCGRINALLTRHVLMETPLRRCAETGRSAHGLQLAAVQGVLFA